MKLQRLWTALLGALLAIGSFAAPRPKGVGTVGGQVLDQKDKPVAGIHVTLQDSEGGHLQATETNAQGRFWIPFLPEGQYSVRASDQGRTSEWVKNVWVSPGRETDVTLHLQAKNRVSGWSPARDCCVRATSMSVVRLRAKRQTRRLLRNLVALVEEPDTGKSA